MTRAKNGMAGGILCVLLSAVIFGVTPVLAAMSYQGGNNGVNMAFLRVLLPMPILLVLARRSEKNKPDARQRHMTVLLGVMLYGCMLLLYSSYAFLPVGVATTLHFLYPLYVSLYEMIFQRIRKGWLQLLGLGLAVAGGMFFVDAGGGGLDGRGVTLAGLSGMMYAAYVILLGKEARHPRPLYPLMLGISAAGAALCGGFGLLTGRLTTALTGGAWLCACAVAMLTSVGGCVLFQAGVRRIGKADAAIYSLLEPISSIVFGFWLLSEQLSRVRLIGCVLILLGLAATALSRSGRRSGISQAEAK